MKTINKFFFALIIIIFSITITNAEECVITNNNNVEIPCNLYEDLNEYYSTNFLNYMTSSEYDQIKNSDLNAIETITISGENPLIPEDGYYTRGTYYETSYKELRISRNGNFINANLLWVQNPAVRSYDVFGIRFAGPSIVGTPLFREYYRIGNTTYSSSDYSRKDFTNGFGVSVKLPNYYDLESDITFTYTGSGTIFASYQHAITSVTLTQSKKYTLSASGYGHVLLFNTSVQGKYDAMNGVSIQG